MFMSCPCCIFTRIVQKTKPDKQARNVISIGCFIKNKKLVIDFLYRARTAWLSWEITLDIVICSRSFYSSIWDTIARIHLIVYLVNSLAPFISFENNFVSPLHAELLANIGSESHSIHTLSSEKAQVSTTRTMTRCGVILRYVSEVVVCEVVGFEGVFLCNWHILVHLAEFPPSLSTEISAVWIISSVSNRCLIDILIPVLKMSMHTERVSRVVALSDNISRFHTLALFSRGLSVSIDISLVSMFQDEIVSQFIAKTHFFDDIEVFEVRSWHIVGDTTNASEVESVGMPAFFRLV